MGWAILALAIAALLVIGILSVLWAILSFVLKAVFSVLFVLLIVVGIYILFKRLTDR